MERSGNSWSRRAFLLSTTGAVISASRLSAARAAATPASPNTIGANDRVFLEDFEKRCFRYFWEQANPKTGLIMDRAKNDGGSSGNVGSSAATGFGLTALCIGANRGWIPKEQARARVLTTLRYFWAHAFHDHGWFYHFMDASSGERRLHSEVSSIDTALFLAGVLTASSYFSADREIVSLATQIFDRVDFQWMLNGHPMLLSHGVIPGSGFIPDRWGAYSEASILYLLGIGSSRHPLPAESWYAWARPEVHYENKWEFISGGPLFTHQFSHAWIDFRHQTDSDPYYTDFFTNSAVATYAHRDFCISLQSKYPDYGMNMWGITVSDSPRGYMNWGGVVNFGPTDGTLVPCAAAGSLMFAPQICLPVLQEMNTVYGAKVYQRYGFTDAFNPNQDDQKFWVNTDVVGIDVGISLLSIENLISGDVWRWFMRNPYIRSGMERAGFQLATPGLLRMKQKRATTKA